VGQDSAGLRRGGELAYRCRRSGFRVQRSACRISGSPARKIPGASCHRSRDSILAVTASLHPDLCRPLELLDTVALRDLEPVTLIAGVPHLLVVHPSLPAKSIRELIALAKTRPGELNYASAGNGSPFHLAAELFNLLAGVKMNHVSYKGGGPAVVDVMTPRTPRDDSCYYAFFCSPLKNRQCGGWRAAPSKSFTARCMRIGVFTVDARVASDVL